MTVLTGTLGVEDVLQNKQVRDVSKGLYHKYLDLNPLTALLMKMPKGRTAYNPKVFWHRQDLLPRWDVISAVTTASGATVVFTPTTVDRFKLGDVVEIPQLSPGATETNIGVVTTLATTVTLTAVGWQSNLAATASTFPTITGGMNAHIINDSSEEYSQKPAMKVNKVAEEWNHIHFSRVPYVIGNIEEEVKQYTGDERPSRRTETYKDIRIQTEENMFHGERYYRDGTNGRQFFARGFRRFIQQGAGVNILDWSSGLTESNFDEFLQKGCCKAGIGSSVRFGFFSDNLCLRLNEIGKAKQRIVEGGTTVLGMHFNTYVAPNGTRLHYRDHHLMVEDYENAGLIIDPTRARIRPYGTQGVMRLLTDIQENDRAGVADEWQIIYSLEIDRIEPMAWIDKG